MDVPERDRALLDHFDRLLDLDPGKQAAYLDDLRRRDATLCRELEAMLAHADVSTGVLAPERLRDHAADPLTGAQVGDYRVGERLGEGGMGVVYRAGRTDGRFEQVVALKLLRAGWLAPDELRRRFDQEVRLQGQLDHPNIARVLGAGTTEAGLSYFVMEYVDGEPVDVYCEARRLDVAARLRLVADVCRAVQYAHQHLIIHRDLKPSNILVTPDGVVKLLDFGIAKLLAEESGEVEATLTRTGMRPMTPEYAAPEQIRGEPVTTATDVYALGVILYEVLTGRRPYVIGPQATPSEVERIVCESEPERPSTVMGRTALPDGTRSDRQARRLRGDVDTIVLKALRKEPGRRYATASELAEDLRRHLAGLPIAAHPDTVGYRTAKFVRRHRHGVATTLGGVLLLLSFGLIYTIRVSQERDRAELALQRAEHVTAFTASLFEATDPSVAQGDTLTVYAVMEQGAARVREELSGEPVVQAAMFHVIGQVQSQLGRYDEAVSLLTEALHLRRTHLGAHPDLAATLAQLGYVRYRQSQNAEAAAFLREGLALQRSLLGERHPDVAMTKHQLGLVLSSEGTYDEAEALMRDALATLEAAPGQEAREQAALVLTDLGSFVRRIRRDLEEAERLLRQARSLYQGPGVRNRLDASGATMHLASVLHEKGDLVGAESLFVQALATLRAVLGNEHPQVAGMMSDVGQFYQSAGMREQAEAIHREALAMRRRLLGPNSKDVAVSLHNLGALTRSQGKPEASEAYLREALSIFRALYGDEHLNVASTLNELAMTLQRNGLKEEPEEMLLESLRIRRSILGADHASLGLPLHNLGVFYYRTRGDKEQATVYFREAAQVMRKHLGDDHLDVAHPLFALATALYDLGRLEEAEPYYREALAIRTKALPEGHRLIVEVQQHLDRCLAAMQKAQ